MKSALIFSLIYICGSLSLTAQSVKGTWQILNKKGEPESLIKVYEENGYLYGRCIELLEAADLLTCKKCKGKDKGKSLEGMLLFKDCKNDGTKWSEGKILDPEKGKHYDCQVSLKEDNVLKVRGYVGNPLFGKTLLWYRVK